MIELTKINLRDFQRKSSKGNQLKFEYDGIWYKADQNGYEGLAEYVVSNLLKKTWLEETEYVLYETEKIKYSGNIYNACRSKNFLKNGDSVITLARLYELETGDNIYNAIEKIKSPEMKFKFIVEFVRSITKLKDFDVYFAQMLILDAIFLNEDRHMHNIAVIKKENGIYDYCPLFDFGASLLSDINIDYPLNVRENILMRKVKSKTISTSFKKQYEVAMKVLNRNIISFNIGDVEEIIKKDTIYSEDIKNRVLLILKEQIEVYLS